MTKEYSCSKLLLITAVIPYCLISCTSQSPDESVSKIYADAIHDALFNKLLFQPYVLNNLSWAQSEDSTLRSPYGEIVFHEQLNLKLDSKFTSKKPYFYVYYAEQHVAEMKSKIYLIEEGNFITKEREFNPYYLDDELFFNRLSYLVTADSFPNIGVVEDSTLIHSSTVIRLYRPYQSENSIYQHIQFSDSTSFSKVFLTIVLDKHTYELRSHENF